MSVESKFLPPATHTSPPRAPCPPSVRIRMVLNRRGRRERRGNKLFSPRSLRPPRFNSSCPRPAIRASQELDSAALISTLSASTSRRNRAEAQSRGEGAENLRQFLSLRLRGSARTKRRTDPDLDFSDLGICFEIRASNLRTDRLLRLTPVSRPLTPSSSPRPASKDMQSRICGARGEQRDYGGSPNFVTIRVTAV
jgi:hypothetical protein